MDQHTHNNTLNKFYLDDANSLTAMCRTQVLCKKIFVSPMREKKVNTWKWIGLQVNLLSDYLFYFSYSFTFLMFTIILRDLMADLSVPFGFYSDDCFNRVVVLFNFWICVCECPVDIYIYIYIYIHTHTFLCIWTALSFPC